LFICLFEFRAVAILFISGAQSPVLHTPAR
jgi:hypothetical protein